ncbi:MAG TPA: glycoside hydrolase family 15 protein [Candidatus Binatia bacterium]|nr:glycoside hydrolase family 15 protein [Candidatus Binatia bacterium]
MPYEPIESYGIIGNLETVALVGQNGSIDFFCAPLFDSPSVFAALLDDARGGRFRLAPLLEGATRKQLYLPDTNVLLTRFLSDGGVAEVSDFMPVDEDGAPAVLVRRAKTVRGEVRFRLVCEPRFDYARAMPSIERAKDGVVFTATGAHGIALRLRSQVPLRIENDGAVAEFTLRADESASFVLEEVQPGRPLLSDAPDYVAESFKKTVNFWRGWLSRSRYRGRWREMVNRSALILKMLTSRRYGSIVAAPTFGLPEMVGGSRNWDYRYTWIRDSSFTLYGLMRLGYTGEAAAFMRWVEARCEELEPSGSLQIMYGIDGRHELPEETLPHLEGYLKSSPVRIGNAAQTHLQLDIYGELMDSVYLFDKYGEPISYDLWCNLSRAMDWVVENWRQPDESIWEVRGGRREFLYSRVQCWAALDRAVRLCRKRSFPGPIERWRRCRDEIYHEIFAEFWNPERKCFMQAKGVDAVDAASLLMPLIKFIGPTDPRWVSTLRAIEQHLVSDSLVYRYKIGDSAPDGLSGNEGTFSMCTFWYAECLSRLGDVQKARFFFEKMLGYANHLGLYGEELGPRGQHLGNFPQAFTHLALISAAYDIDRRLPDSGAES